ncbi:hypothetical protein CRUP_004189 [Coryphaenoides rupestris]|nr:hypothetical protein CRUP_004189 [Coryphaenoides rupestris]
MEPDAPRYRIDRPSYNIADFDEDFDKKDRQFPVLGGPAEGPGMAFALLASLPPVNGLYSSFFPLIPYFFMGTAHQMVPGTFAVLSIMVGMVCLRLAPEADFSHYNATLNATVVDTATMDEVRLGISGTLACLTAIIQMGLGLMQFGFVAIYLSESFIRGFMTAAGLQILISVLKYIFGIRVPPYSGPLAVVYTLVDIVCGLPHTNVASLLFALISSAVLCVSKELGARYRHKLPFPVPMEIVIVVVATAISGPLDLPEIYHMDIVGEIPLGFPAPILPTVCQWEEMLSTAFSLAIVGYVINLAMGRTLAAKHGYDVDANQIHVICCALSVTLAVDNAGGKSQFASLCVMLVVMVTMLALGVYLKPLPKSVLGALIAVNLKNTLLQLSDPYYLWQRSRLDCCVWVVSFLATFFLSLPYGVAIGVSFSILVVVFKTQFRNGSAVEQIMDTDIYRNPKVYSKKESEAKKEERESQRRKPSSLVGMKRQTISQLELQSDFDARIDSLPATPTAAAAAPTSYANFRCSDGGGLEEEEVVEEQTPDPDGPPALTLDPQTPVPFHSLVLDLAGVCFVDLNGIKVLTKVYEELEVGGVFDGEGGLSRRRLFLSVHDAVLRCSERPPTRRPADPPTRRPAAT